MNFIRLLTEIKDEISAITFLQNRGILHRQKICSNGHDMKLSIGSQPRWRCRKRQCREEVGIRVGTWYFNSKMPFQKSIFFIYWWSKELSSLKFCKSELNINPSTTVDWNNYMREVCFWKIQQNGNEIGGNNLTVEIDESLFSKRKNHAGRMLPQQWVFGGICRETKECFLMAVPDRSANTLIPIIQERIRTGSTIISDKWKAYNGIRNAGYNHETVNHTFNFVDPTSGAHTQNVERMWGSAKCRNKRQRGTHRIMIDSYMAEYMWRCINRDSCHFEAILDDIAGFSPPQ